MEKQIPSDIDTKPQEVPPLVAVHSDHPTSGPPVLLDVDEHQCVSKTLSPSYITVSGLTDSISVEDIVAYFQSARCGGGSVVKVVYQDHSKTQALVGIGKVELNTSHKLFKGKHVLNHRQLNVQLSPNPPPPKENPDLVAYVHEETNPIEGMLPNSSATHANVMAIPNAHTPKTIPVQGPLHKYLLASQCQDVAPQELEENKHAQFINPPSSLHVSHNMSDTPTHGNNDGIDSEVTITAPEGMGATLHAAITAHNPYTDVTVTLSSEGNLVLRGRKKGVEKLKIEVERMIHDNTIANTVTVTVQSQSLPPQVLVYIEKCVRERMMNTYNIQFKTDIQTNTLEVFGTRASCTHFMNAVQSFNPNCVDVTLPAEGVSLLASPQGMAVIRNVIGQRPIGHLFTGPGGSVACSVAEASKLHLVAEKYEDLVYIAQQLQNNIVVHEYPVPKQFFILPSSSSWTNICQALETNFTAQLSSHADKGIVTIACNKQHLENVKNGLHEFCEKEGFCKEVLTLQKKEWEHLKQFRDWTNLTAKMNSSGLQVELPSSWDQTPTISFQGEVAAVRYYTQKTKEIIDNIARQTRDTSRLANTQLCKSVSGRQPGMGSTNHITADCQITLDKRSDKSDPGNQPTHPVLDPSTTGQNVGIVQPSKEHTLAAKTMDAKSIIEMKRGSLTDYQADVYVNTAHCTLNLKHGAVAQTLLKAGGPALQAECNQYIAQHGNIPDWGYAVTGGGNLKCKHIIHAVGSQYVKGAAEKGMEKMMTNIIAECDRLQASSVAFPAIGTGALGFPDNTVAKIMLEAISRYLQAHPSSRIQQIFLVIFMDKTHKAFQSLMHSPMNVYDSQDVEPAQSESSSVNYRSATPRYSTVADNQECSDSQSIVAPSVVQSTALQSFKTNDVNIDIIHGDITNEDCDGIVSTSSHDLTLHPFGVMGALLKKGGTELQQECTAAVQRYGHLHSSKVIVTGTGRPGGLKCRRILHIQAPHVANDLQKVVKAVLREADKESLSIVSLPAIGTGQHGFTPRVAAEGICEAIVEFSKSNPRHVKCVKVVLFQEEHYSSFSAAFTAASSEKGLSTLRNALSHVRSAITPGHRSTNSETSVVHRPPHTFPSHTKPQQTGHTQYAARNPADSKYTSFSTEDFRRPNFVHESTQEDKPSTWDRMPTDPLTGKEDTYHLVDLPQHSVEYKEVSQAFHQTISFYKIKKIQRIQNPKLWSQYAARKKIMDRENPQLTQNERKLFHGCAVGAVEPINHTGFNRSYAGANGTRFGKGMYFARDASYSARYAVSSSIPPHMGIGIGTGQCQMYLARVLTGEFVKGDNSMLVPPPKDPNNSNVLFDSVVDDVQNPSIFVVFYDAQAYPEYLITFN
jgi:O-acetyl-ADP-ribose deacetylase (regulator of RNase III)